MFVIILWSIIKVHIHRRQSTEKQIQKILNQGISFFGKDEVIYVYECKKCHKLDPVPSFVINEHLEFLKFIIAKKSFEMECPYCGGPSFPIKTSEDK